MKQQIDLDPHEYRQPGKPRLWGRKTVIRFGLVALGIEAVVAAVFFGRPDIIPAQTLLIVAVLTWPWMVIFGAAIGYLTPQFFFEDDKQR